MSLSSDDVSKLAHLARLEIGPEELREVADKLSEIVAMVDELKAAATEEVVPMAHPLDRQQRLREDQVTEQDQRDLFQENAPAVERGLYLVPKVIE